MKTHIASAAALCLVVTGRLLAVPTAIDYNTGFTNPTQVITSDQPLGAISGDPTTGVTFTNPNFFNNPFAGTLENDNLYTQQFGGALTIGLPGLSDAFGLTIGANSGGSDAVVFDFYSGATFVGTASFSLPFGQPTNPAPTAFSSTTAFDSVLITAPNNGFMRIGEDSIKFQRTSAVNSVPDGSDSLGCLLLGLGMLAFIRRRRAAA